MLRAYADGVVGEATPTLFDHYADDCTFHYSGTTDLAGTHVGKEACLTAMITARTRAPRELLEIVDVLAGDVVRRAGGARAAGARRRVPRGRRACCAFRVADGHIAECWLLDEDQAPHRPPLAALMPGRRFQQVDVFTEVPTRGNPVAVVVDGDGLDDGQMRAFAAWTNLSRDDVPPPADRSGRRLPRADPHPAGELPFAGHPTLGSAHAWLAAGGAAQGRGRRAGVRGGARAAAPRRRPALVRRPAARAERGPGAERAGRHARRARADGRPGRALAVLVNGPHWLGLEVPDVETVLALEPDHAALVALPQVGVLARYPEGAECAIEVRGFADCVGIPEDPVTGSLQASLAQWLIADGVLPPTYTASQGTGMGRVGRAHLEPVDGAGVGRRRHPHRDRRQVDL